MAVIGSVDLVHFGGESSGSNTRVDFSALNIHFNLCAAGS